MTSFYTWEHNLTNKKNYLNINYKVENEINKYWMINKLNFLKTKIALNTPIKLLHWYEYFLKKCVLYSNKVNVRTNWKVLVEILKEFPICLTKYVFLKRKNNFKIDIRLLGVKIKIQFEELKFKTYTNTYTKKKSSVKRN